jgi:tetratricopeptide (TPR) repeat protein
MAWLLDERGWREKWRLHAGWSVMVLAQVWICAQAQSAEALRVATAPTERAWIAIDALASYARAWLMPLDLCVDNGRNPQFVLAERPWLLWAAMLGVWILWWRRCGVRDPLLSLCALAPVLGVIPFAFQNTSTVADRYAYLALLGPALSIARGQGRSAWLVPMGALAACVLFWVPLSLRQQGFWKSDTALFERALAVNPRSAVAHSNLGLVALRDGRLADAKARYEQALVLRPADARARANLGLCLFQAGQVQAGLSELRAALAAQPDYLRARANLVRGLMQTGETAGAREQAQELVRRHPDSAEAWTLHGQVGLAVGDSQQARASALRALEILPDYGPARALLGEGPETGR